LLEKVKDQQNAEIMEVLHSWIKGNDLKGYGDFSWFGRKRDGRKQGGISVLRNNMDSY